MMAVVREMKKWICKIMKGLPMRTLPIMYMDMNSGMGHEWNTELAWCRVRGSASIGPFNGGRENIIGTTMREILDMYGMCLPHMFQRELPWTYYNNRGGGSHIDMIAVPIALMTDHRFHLVAAVYLRSGRNLQLIKSRTLKNHVPTAIHFYGYTHHITTVQKPAFDRDQLCLCMLKGVQRDHLVSVVRKMYMKPI